MVTHDGYNIVSKNKFSPMTTPRIMIIRLDNGQHGMIFLNLAYGAVAQLGERLNGIQEVDGSIPFSSTIYFFAFFNALFRALPASLIRIMISN